MNSRLRRLGQLISEWPGLVSGPAEALIEDSLVLLDYLGSAQTLVDVGSGGGLPGLALKVSRPELRVTLVESDQQKAAFLVQTSARLGLEDVEVVNQRAEDAGRDPRYREVFDVATARALAQMRVLVELCLPFVRIGGKLLAQKTEGENVREASHAIDVLGGSLEDIFEAPTAARNRGTIVVVAKVRPTPAAYPRRRGVPSRKPL